MSDQQKLSRNRNSPNGDFVAIPWEMLTPVQQRIVDYKALGGIIIDEDGIPKRKKVADFMAEMGYVRYSYYEMLAQIPNIDDLVAERRKILARGTRLDVVHKAWFLRAAKGEWQHLNAYLLNFDKDYKVPTEKRQVEVTDTWGTFARKRLAEKAEPLEGEVVEQANDTA